MYARVSTDEQRQGHTIESQIAELERFAAEKGWAATAIYKDEGWSGAILARPELDRLRDDVAKGLFDAVLINDVDRLARNVSHLGIIKCDLEQQGIKVIFRKLPAESSPTHNLLVNILGSFAEFERELIADRTRRGRRHKVEVRKQFIGAIPPYGFIYVPKASSSGKEGRLELSDEEAEVVRCIYQWADEEGLSAHKVVERLNRMKMPTRKGGPKWQKSSVLRILRSEVYAGVWYYNKFKKSYPRLPPGRNGQKTELRRRPKVEWIPLALPEHLRIIDRNQWERVQRQLDRNIAFSPRNARHQYLLKGLVQCGGCGARYIGDPSHGMFYYRCLARCRRSPAIKEDFLNDTVWSAVREALQNPNLIAEQVEGLREKLAESGKRSIGPLRSIERTFHQLDKEESRILEAYRLEILSQEQLRQELEKIQAKRTLLESRKRELEEAVPRIPAAVLRQSLRTYCKAVSTKMETMDFDDKQKLLRMLVRRVDFESERVKITAVIPVGGPADSGKEPNSKSEGGYHKLSRMDGHGDTAGQIYSHDLLKKWSQFGSPCDDRTTLATHKNGNCIVFEFTKPVLKANSGSPAGFHRESTNTASARG